VLGQEFVRILLVSATEAEAAPPCRGMTVPTFVSSRAESQGP
jgi:hypothetical protein